MGEGVVADIVQQGRHTYGQTVIRRGRAELTQIFQGAHNFAVTKGKPLYIIECGCVEAATGAKASWINDAAATIQSWPEVVGFSYNHENTDCSYWADSSASAVAAFTSMGSQAYFAA